MCCGCAAEEDRGRDRSGHRDGENKDAHGNGHHRSERVDGERPRVYTDGASAQGADLKYGLNYGGSAPQALQRNDRCAGGIPQ